VVSSLFGLLSVWLTLAALTCVGARRRGAGPAAALAAGVLFPVTWVVWYARDERPYRRRHRLA
jgi:hypothetical protein